MLRADAPHFTSFGEIYFSCVNFDVVKGWRRHKRMTQNLAVPVGCVRLVLHDGRPESATCGQNQDIMLGPDATYALVVVPPGIWSAFKGMSAGMSVIANCASILHDSEEAESRPMNDPMFKFDW